MRRAEGDADSTEVAEKRGGRGNGCSDSGSADEYKGDGV